MYEAEQRSQSGRTGYRGSPCGHSANSARKTDWRAFRGLYLCQTEPCVRPTLNNKLSTGFSNMYKQAYLHNIPFHPQEPQAEYEGQNRFLPCRWFFKVDGGELESPVLCPGTLGFLPNAWWIPPQIDLFCLSSGEHSVSIPYFGQRRSSPRRILAEQVGFEPTGPPQVQPLSRRSQSTTLPLLHIYAETSCHSILQLIHGQSDEIDSPQDPKTLKIQ